jgi:hypothetical protein
MSFRYVVHNEEGRVTGVHVVYDPTGFPNVLHERGIKHVHIPGPGGLPRHDRHYVDVKTGKLIKRPDIAPAINKQQIKANGMDVAHIARLPKPCEVTVFLNGIAIGPAAKNTDGELEIAAQRPGRYRIQVDAWPHRRWAIEIEAVE